MRRRLIEHIGSSAFVTLIFALLVFSLKDRQEADRRERSRLVAPYLNLPTLDFGSPRDRALFKETLDLFRPDSRAANDSLVEAIEEYRQSQFIDPALKTGGGDRGLSWAAVRRLGGMYLQFVFVYAVVLGLTFYAAQSLGMYRFVRLKQGRESNLVELLQLLRARNLPESKGGNRVRSVQLIVHLLRAVAKVIAYAILFSPAYVIGYAVKTSIDMGSVLFMILLGVVSNGLLINYANKFYTLLVAESRKGYVETALVKNLSGIYAWNVPAGISYKSILSLPRRFPGHVFQHVYLNARHQYLPTLKEQASFLITGLIIIEMALNIQGHLCYELLQTILYRQYDVALAIVLGIFLLVKVTEILVDTRRHKEGLRYENRG
jgi:hypothetical protein